MIAVCRCEGFERHATDGTASRLVADDLRMHRAVYFNFRNWLCDRSGLLRMLLGAVVLLRVGFEFFQTGLAAEVPRLAALFD